jgi:hypothetical protein
LIARCSSLVELRPPNTVQPTEEECAAVCFEEGGIDCEDRRVDWRGLYLASTAAAPGSVTREQLDDIRSMAERDIKSWVPRSNQHERATATLALVREYGAVVQHGNEGWALAAKRTRENVALRATVKVLRQFYGALPDIDEEVGAALDRLDQFYEDRASLPTPKPGEGG